MVPRNRAHVAKANTILRGKGILIIDGECALNDPLRINYTANSNPAFRRRDERSRQNLPHPIGWVAVHVPTLPCMLRRVMTNNEQFESFLWMMATNTANTVNKSHVFRTSSQNNHCKASRTYLDNGSERELQRDRSWKALPPSPLSPLWTGERGLFITSPKRDNCKGIGLERRSCRSGRNARLRLMHGLAS